MLTEEALEECGYNFRIDFVENGIELFQYLELSESTVAPRNAPLPAIIILDLNMPKMDGRQTLEKLKNHSVYKRIPVIVLTTSNAEEDIAKSYNMGVSSFITKPVNYSGLVDIMNTLGKYWLQIVELPQ